MRKGSQQCLHYELRQFFDQIAAVDASAVLAELGEGKVTDARLPLGAWFNPF